MAHYPVAHPHRCAYVQEMDKRIFLAMCEMLGVRRPTRKQMGKWTQQDAELQRRANLRKYIDRGYAFDPNAK